MVPLAHDRDKERPVISCNSVALVGQLIETPVLGVAASGSAITSGMIELFERGVNDQVFYTRVPLIAIGRLGERLGTCGAGETIAVGGKLSWRKADGARPAGVAIFVLSLERELEESTS
jgi:hypothetical protein